MRQPSLLQRLAAVAVRRPALAIASCLGFCLLASLGCMFVRLQTQIHALLPHGHPVLDRFALVQERFAAEDLLGFVVIHQADDPTGAERGKALLQHLATRVRSWKWEAPEGPEPMVRAMQGLPDPATEQALLDQVVPELWLLMDDARLDQLVGMLRPRVVASRLRSPHTIKPAWRDRDALGLMGHCYLPWLEQQQKDAMVLDRDGDYLRSPDGTCHVLLCQAAREAAHSGFCQAVARQVGSLQEELAGDARVQGLEWKALGPYLLAARDYRSAWDGAFSTLISSLVGVLALFALAYRSLRLPGLIVLGLVPTCTAALGLTCLLWGGELTMVVLAFAAILIGLGVDFVIHLYNGYLWAMAERLKVAGRPENRSAARRLRAVCALRAVRRLSGGLVAAAATSIGTFLLLLLSHYRGLSELGAVCGLGLALCLVLMVVLVPAFLTCAGPLVGKAPDWVGPLARSLVNRSRIWACGVVAVLVASAIYLGTRPQLIVYDRDPRNLRPADDALFMDHMRLADRLGLLTSGHQVLLEGTDPEAVLRAGQHFLQGLRTHTTPDELVLAEPLDAAELAHGAVRPVLRIQGLNLPPQRLRGRYSVQTPLGILAFERIDGDRLLRVQAQRSLPWTPGRLETGTVVKLLPIVHGLNQPITWLAGPDRQRAVLDRLRKEVDWAGIDAALAELPVELTQQRAPTLALLQRIRNRLTSGDLLMPGDFAATPLASLVALAWLEEDGRTWLKLSLDLNHPTGQAGLDQVMEAVGVPGDGAWTELERGVRLGLCGVPAIAGLLSEILVADFERLSLLGGLLTLVLLVLCLRSVRSVLLSSASLCCGLLLGLTGMHLLGMPWNLMNIAVVPLVMGIGVDSGVYFAHALTLKDRSRSAVTRCLTEVGHPLLITTLTSVIGFASLAQHSYRGIQSVGLTAAIGITACLIVALTVPPLLALIGRKD